MDVQAAREAISKLTWKELTWFDRNVEREIFIRTWPILLGIVGFVVLCIVASYVVVKIRRR